MVTAEHVPSGNERLTVGWGNSPPAGLPSEVRLRSERRAPVGSTRQVARQQNLNPQPYGHGTNHVRQRPHGR